ncbi:MAG: DNA primase catalytic subunit PriS, partial [Thermoplasmata archaeon]|nr:DNA primase catalytic subunit PriS [Thermoplasmata archaeon]
MPEGDDSGLIRTSRWLVKRFGTYYSDVKLLLPLRYTRREWAFLFFDKSFMIRHLDFERRSQIQDFIRKEVPRHVYYSTAYYENPDAKTMPEKGWQGATLIFDLDADHLPEASEMEYGEMLTEVKREFKKLVDVWLVKKLGFELDDLSIVFSGGRGYHVHVNDNRVLDFNAFERREIVDLVTGKANFAHFLDEVPFHAGTRMDGRGYTSKTHILPNPNIGNWKGDISRETLRFFKELDILMKDEMKDQAAEALTLVTDMDNDESIEFLEFLERPDKTGNRRMDRLLDNRILDFQKGLGPAFWERIGGHLFVRLAGEADEPVTADTKRLIRLPTSLHGKTGFRVVE